MAIDPANLPIFGDPSPTDPPAPVRAACGLLVTGAGVSAAQMTYLSVVGGHDLAIFFVPLALTVWFALSLRAGRAWARFAAVMAACVTLVPGFALFSGPGELGVLLVAVALLVAATRLVYRADVRGYFEPEDCPEQEHV
ncbi:hypothetical protein [Actinokineospora spheciospongiae]|uniref:hypothetical protein n=1 Tax=Actinokineospora spheciospongiae TaxID=909613 RepID=UPI000D7119A6|nr:hypothetical protein [Actinokineospora spheciospongiae]PWW63583.1 hypothetical protein DFQ13_104575 [Actinokineospora spheciospongiae]